MHYSMLSKENKENSDSPLKKRSSMLSLNLRRASTASFISQKSLTTAPLTVVPRRNVSSGSQKSALSRFRDSFIRPQDSAASLISLPTPVIASQEKFNSKLQAQRSFLDLRDSHDAYVRQQRALLDELLEMCTEPEVRAEPPQLSGPVRTIAFGPGGLDLNQIVNDMKSYKYAPLGFIQTEAIYVVGSEESMCVYHKLRPSGTPLPDFKLESWAEGYEVFWQVASHLAAAERRHHFEHRDILPHNVLVERNTLTRELTVVIGGLENCRFRLPNESVAFSRLDKPYFFNTADQRTREVYKSMQHMLLEGSASASDPAWDQFQPRTNVLWLHVLCEYILGSVSAPEHHLRKRLAKIEQVLNQKRRRLLRTRIDSACDLVAWGSRVLR